MNFLFKFLKKSNILSDSRKDEDFSTLSSTEDFHAVIKREVARANRSNKKFSLIVFDIGSRNEDGSFTNFLINFLSARVRLSDEVGWFNEKSIGVLLPDTSLEGAWKLAGEIRQKITLTISSPPCTVYLYPSPEWPSEIE